MKKFVAEGRYARLCPYCAGRFEETKRPGVVRMERCRTCPPFSLNDQRAHEMQVRSPAAQIAARRYARRHYQEKRAHE